MSPFVDFLIVFLLAFSVALILAPISEWLSHRFNIKSVPDERRHETYPIPKLGGLVIFGGFMVGVIGAQLLPVPRQDPNEVIRIIGLLLGGTVIFIVGVLDDIIEFSFVPQFIGQFIAAGIAIAFQIFIEFFNNPFTGNQTDPWAFAVTVALTPLLVGLDDEYRQFLGWCGWLIWWSRLYCWRNALHQQCVSG